MNLKTLYYFVIISCISVSCTDTTLYRTGKDPWISNKVTMSGHLCTDDATENSFPVKVLFMIDASPSIGEFDPNSKRSTAIFDVINYHMSPNYKFSIMKFSSFAVQLTNEFTKDISMLMESASATSLRPETGCENGQCRDYLGAWSYANSIITGDIFNTNLGEISRTRYVVVLFVNGPPEPELEVNEQECNETCQITTQINKLKDFCAKNNVGELIIHTVYLENDELSEERANETEKLLEEIAFTGEGSYSSFLYSEQINFLNLNFKSMESTFTKKSFFLYNQNTILENNIIVPDSDGDGISDSKELLYGTNNKKADTDGDGINDKVELLFQSVGFDPLNTNEPIECIDIELYKDSDGDGLNNCEETILGTNPSLFDTDTDGLPDKLEFNFKTNPIIPDLFDDNDFDGVSNYEEIRIHTDPTNNDSSSNGLLGYKYEEYDEGIKTIPFFSNPGNITGVKIKSVSLKTTRGVGRLSFDINENAQPILSWKDPVDIEFGDPVVIINSDTYTLHSFMSDINDEQNSLAITITTIINDLPKEPKTDNILISSSKRNCFTFKVKNITLVETDINIYNNEKGWNYIYLYFGQVPVSNPDSYGIFKVALKPIRFLEPDFRSPSETEILLNNNDFVLMNTGN